MNDIITIIATVIGSLLFGLILRELSVKRGNKKVQEDLKKEYEERANEIKQNHNSGSDLDNLTYINSVLKRRRNTDK